VKLRNAWVAVVLAWATIVSAQQSTSSSPAGLACNDAKLFSGNFATTLCVNCILPIRIAGVPYGGLAINVPIGAASPSCFCPGRIFGTPTWGVTLGMWQPQHIIEVVRNPYCSPIMGKSLAGKASAGSGAVTGLHFGGYGQGGADEPQAFYQFHIYSFPVNQLLDQMTDAVCVSHAGSDMDMLYMSEIDPTWNNELLSIYQTPEAILFANPIAAAACATDAAQATAYQPNPFMFWCAGSWGTVYPFAGGTTEQGDPMRDSSLNATRGVAMLQRRGLLMKTMGDDAVCHAYPEPLFVRNQYKMQTVFPVPELGSSHWIGASPFVWGEWRSIPGVGEDFVYLLYNWVDCCMNE